MRAVLHGSGLDDLAAALVEVGLDGGDACVWVNLAGDAPEGIAKAGEFADAVASGREALVVHVLRGAGPDTALLWAHTRQAALAWAPRRIRVNAIGLGVSPVLADQSLADAGRAAGAAPALPASLADIAGTVMAMWRFSSMTGQIVRLGAI